MRHLTFLVTLVILGIVMMDLIDAWKGNVETVQRSRRVRVRYCVSWHRWWGCSLWRSYWRTTYYTEHMCSPGWTHNGDQNCVIPSEEHQ